MRTITAQKRKIFTPLLSFSLIIFLISLHDGIISYVTPVIINNKLNDTFLVGIVLSISSTFGMLFNFVIAKFFPNKTYKFFTSWMLVFGIAMPTILLLFPNAIVTFVIAMVVWSVYYEFRNYSKYDFVHKFLPSQKNTEAWSMMTVFQSTAYMVGPLLTLYLLNVGMKIPLYASILITLLASILYVSLIGNFTKRQIHQQNNQGIRSFLKEIKILQIIAKRIWPLVLFSFALTILDVSFWTIGVLYSEKLRSVNEVGGLFVTLYCLPTILVGMIVPRIFGFLGKKRTSFIAGLLAGFGLILIGVVKNVYTVLVTVFFTAIFADTAFILIFATFEDYITRLDEGGNDLVSIGQFAQNLAYSIGPIFLGFISRNERYGYAFIVSGIVLILSSFLAFLAVPRKIRMPHKELAVELEK